MNLSPAKQKFVDCASAKYGEGAVLTRAQIDEMGRSEWLFQICPIFRLEA